MIELASRLFRRGAENHGQNLPKADVIVPLAPRIEQLLTKAYLAQSHDDMVGARVFYLEAASQAQAIYTTIKTKGVTPEDKEYYATHAQSAVTSLLSSGQIGEARKFARTAIDDVSVSDDYKKRIQKAIEISA